MTKITNLTNNEPRIIGYWEGYAEQSIDHVPHAPFPLINIPSYYTHVPIAFCAPARANPDDKLATTWEFDDPFVYTKEQIFGWVKDLKNTRGESIKILLSFQDTENIKLYPDVDIEVFAKNIAKDIYKYGLDGFDVDAESHMSVKSKHESWWTDTKSFLSVPFKYTDPFAPTFIHLIEALRSNFDRLAAEHPEIPRKIISYTCYTGSDYDKQILSATKNNIDYLSTMAYWDDPESAIALFRFYADLIGDPNKVAIGVMCPPGPTNLDRVKQIGGWLVTNGFRSMMLWSATRDVEVVSGLPDQTYGQTISDILNNNLTHKHKESTCVDSILNTVKSLFCCGWGYKSSELKHSASIKATYKKSTARM